MDRFSAGRLLGPVLLLVGLVVAGCASADAGGGPTAGDDPDQPVTGPVDDHPTASPSPPPDPTTGGLLVTVHDPAGDPLAGACLDLQPLEPGLPPLPELARCTGPDGEYHLPALSAGRYRLTTSGPTGDTTSTEVTVPVGDPTRVTVTVAG